MPAATPKKSPKPKEHKVKGLESDEALDNILAQFAEERSRQILNDATLFSKESSPKPDLGSKSERRARRKELQARTLKVQQEAQQADENQDMCLRCGHISCKLMHWLPGDYPDGQFTCLLCTQGGVANGGVYHCVDCNWDAHVSCYSRKKEEAFAERPPVPVPAADADCPKPSLAWDPLALTGPHMAIGAGAGLRNIGEVALD